MTIATFSQPIDIKKFSVSYDLPTELSTTKLQLGFFNGKATPTEFITFYGNFIPTADGMGLANGSTTNAIDVSILGVEQFKFSALTNNDVIKMQSYVITKNYSGLLEYLFAGNDQITGSFGDDVLSGFSGNDIVNSGAGKDTVVFSGHSKNYTITPTATNVSVKNTVTNEIDTLTNTEFLRFDDKTIPTPVYETPKTPTNPTTGATAGNDKLTGTAKNDTLNGLNGNDTLIGGSGADKLTGGLGKDTFKFSSINDSGITAVTRDKIMDFNHQENDKIDLSEIDSNAKTLGNQAFKFIGTKEFSANATAQLRFDAKNHILYGSTNADKTAEFSIELNGISKLVVDDFVL